MRRAGLIIAGFTALALAGAARAQDLGLTSSEANNLGISEIRGGVMAHSFDEPGPTSPSYDLSHIQDLNLEVLFQPLPTASWFPGMVRPNVGATIDFGGLESQAYAGLSWKLPVLSSPLFVEAGFGGSINNGIRDGALAPARDVGCNVLFHEQLSVGYDISDNADIMLTGEHSSSANLCTPNRGLSNIGIRFGWKF